MIFIMLSTIGAESDSLLQILDDIIPQRNRYSDERRERIATELQNLENATSDENRYGICRVLYSQYRSYRIDSALWISEQRLMAARRLGSHSKSISASLNLAESHAHAGNYSDAIAILDTINRNAIEPYHVNYLWNLYAATYKKMARYSVLGYHKLLYEQKSRNYQDSLLSQTDATGSTYSLIRCEQLMHNGLAKEARELANKSRQRFELEDDASALCLLADIYGKSGDEGLKIACLAKAAIIDLQKGIKEYTALTDLALALYQRDDIDRAYSYIKCALEDASFCNAKTRTSEIMEIMPIINSAVREKEQAHTRRVRTYMIVTLILAIALMAALLIVKKQLNRNSQISRNLDKSNAELTDINERLTESNLAKEAYINELFKQCSLYIDKLGKYRKNIYRLMKTGQYDDVLQMTKSSKLESDEMKDFYAAFDEMFLTLYPNFIRDFNTLIAAEHRFDESSRSLTPELRVMALKRIGVPSSNIAKLLHYTPQTVYNYRSTIKTMLIVSKDEFDRQMKEIGR